MNLPDMSPCPFCGGGADVHTNPGGVIWVECAECEAQVPGSDEITAIENWNSRATDGVQPTRAPVAWRYRSRDSSGRWGDWRHTDMPVQGPAHAGFEIEPLYTDGVQPVDERQQFEAKFPKPDAVTWTGSDYEVREGWENSYRIDRFLGQWEAWQAARGVRPSDDARDAARYRWLRKNRWITLICIWFGNGSVNKTIEMAEEKLDAEIATNGVPSGCIASAGTRNEDTK